MVPDIPTLIAELAEMEQTAVAHLSSPREGQADLYRSAQEHLSVDVDGRLVPPGDKMGAWANAADGTSVLRQLLIAPALLVNLLPIPEKDFIVRYGVNPAQMLTLAEKGLIVPELTAFETGADPLERHRTSKTSAAYMTIRC